MVKIVFNFTDEPIRKPMIRKAFRRLLTISAIYSPFPPPAHKSPRYPTDPLSDRYSKNFLIFPPVNLIGNLIWLIFGGFFAAIGYIVGGFVLCLTIVGIPFGLQCFKLANLVLWPFGKQVVPSRGGMGCLGLFCNIIWLICGGLYTAVIHLFFAAILFVTIIGIPFGRQHLKLMELSLMPFGREVI